MCDLWSCRRELVIRVVFAEQETYGTQNLEDHKFEPLFSYKHKQKSDEYDQKKTWIAFRLTTTIYNVQMICSGWHSYKQTKRMHGCMCVANVWASIVTHELAAEYGVGK